MVYHGIFRFSRGGAVCHAALFQNVSYLPGVYAPGSGMVGNEVSRGAHVRGIVVVKALASCDYILALC